MQGSSPDSPQPKGRRGWFARLLREHVLDNVRATETASRDHLDALVASAESTGTLKPDTRVVVVLLVAVFNLAAIQYFGMSNAWTWLEPVLGVFGDPAPAMTLRKLFKWGPNAELYRLVYWVASTVLGYFVVPALVVKLVFKQKLRDYGLQLEGLHKHTLLYVLMYLAVLPLVLIAAQSPSFLKTYPFYSKAGRSLFDLLAWELTYATQFFALEFFFRGFLIHGTKHRLGIYAVLVSVIPYCMIHFGKPFPETIGAIIAGTILGALSLWTRSIWLGVAVHISVAVTMDLLALYVR